MRDDLPLVTIVTPSYNQGEFLERTIRSVLSQDYPNIEYMVVDGGSKDNSAEIIRKYADRLAYWVSEKDKGQSDAINKGWRRAKGIYCSYLNSDDVLEPGAVTAIVNGFKANPDASTVYGDYNYIDVSDSLLEKCKGAPTDFKKLLVNGQIAYIAQPSSFYRMDLIRKIDYVDEQYHLSMDYDLLVKLAKEGRMVYIDKVISSFRLHTAAKTASLAKRHWHETLKVKAKYNKLYMWKSVLLYLRFRLFHFLPESVQDSMRKRRSNVQDKMLLDAKK